MSPIKLPEKPLSALSNGFISSYMCRRCPNSKTFHSLIKIKTNNEAKDIFEKFYLKPMGEIYSFGHSHRTANYLRNKVFPLRVMSKRPKQREKEKRKEQRADLHFILFNLKLNIVGILCMGCCLLLKCDTNCKRIFPFKTAVRQKLS
jgi:hypothetical protein